MRATIRPTPRSPPTTPPTVAGLPGLLAMIAVIEGEYVGVGSVRDDSPFGTLEARLTLKWLSI